MSDPFIPRFGERYTEAIRRFDAANAEDPNLEEVDGVQLPKELAYAQRMTRWLAALDPEAPETVALAARAQHIRRWESPRDRYPMDRKGYHRWRTELYVFHAETAAKILDEVGYDAETVARVERLLRKLGLKQDPQMQLLEDTICVVFLEHYFADFAPQHSREKVITILQKTWKKMTPRGHEAALKLPMSEAARALVGEALGA